MPPVTSQATSSSRKASFYGRARADSSDSDASRGNCSTGSQQRKASSSSNTSRKASPRSKQQTAAIVAAAAANAATKRIIQAKPSTASVQILVDGLKEESQRRLNMLDEEEYQSEIIEHMQHMEAETTASVELMDAQPELRWFMRPYLVDFIVEIHQTFRLRPETLYLTMNIVDRYVSKRIVYKRHYQLVGCAALLIASKFEDAKDKVPTVSELSQMCCSAYDESAFTQMEGHVLSTIGWVLGFPTPEAWLRVAALQNGVDTKTQSIARFLMESSLFHRDFIGLLPSHLMAGSLMLARYICGQSSQQESQETMAAAQILDSYLMENMSDLSEILVKKYSYSHFAHASTVVKEWYVKSAQANAQKTAAATGLLPAQSVSAQHLAELDEANKASANHSSFSTPRRGQNDDDDDESMRSRCTTPSSMISTPSRMSGDEGEEEEDEEEDEEDQDMPVTPLSLNSLHDPLVAAQTSQSDHQKENGAPFQSTKETFLQVKTVRPVLSISQQDNKIPSV